MGMSLFEGSDDNEEISKIQTNKEFARRYEHNKKREELQRLEELKKRGVVDESEDDSEDESEEDDLTNNDLEFFDALVKVKKKDPIINQKDAKLFESESEDEEEEEEEEKPKSKKAKPMYLKDVVAKHLIEDGPELEEKGSKSCVKSYSEEQEEIRKAFLDATEGVFDGEDGDLLMEKKRNKVEDEDSDKEEVQHKLNEYFGGDENLNENDKFMKNFFLNKMWIDKDKGKKPFTEDLRGLSEDEEEVEKQEKYEAEYNFRFEEGAGDRVLGHARFTEGSVRKKTNARKVQRKSKEERMAQAEFERKEELKHLKNLKKKEIEEKLEKIRASAGISEGGACSLNENDLEEEFDPDEYDRKMKETFDADYYDAKDADPSFASDGDEDVDDLEKPDFGKEDELLGLSKGWDVCGSADGFSAIREKILKRKAENKDIDISADGDQEEEEVPAESKRKRQRKIPLREKVALDKELEEYYKLDYEDTIGDLKTRFKYASVPSQRYGLSPAELLTMEDKDLNQYVSLKKMAPYRETEWKVSNDKRYSQKMKNKLVGQGVNLEDQKSGKRHTLKDTGPLTEETGDADQGEAKLEKSNGEVGKMSRRSKRRRRQAELKLSHSRLMAYGKIPATSKNKKKL